MNGQHEPAIPSDKQEQPRNDKQEDSGRPGSCLAALVLVGFIAYRGCNEWKERQSKYLKTDFEIFLENPKKGYPGQPPEIDWEKVPKLPQFRNK